MNYGLLTLEIGVVLAGLAVLLADLWIPAEMRRKLTHAAAGFLGLLLLASFTRWIDSGETGTAFGGMFIQDGMSLFFKRLFLVTAIIVLVFSFDFADRLPSAAIGEYGALTLFALAGMMLAASANDLSVLFVSVELITVTFYVLVSFQRARVVSLEAGVKYLIIGALASAIMVYGIALVYGTAGSMKFDRVAAAAPALADNRVFLIGVLLVMAGLGFKIAAFPMQLWAPDVYQGSPTPTTAFLAIGSKAAGFALLLRFLYTAVPGLSAWLGPVLAVVAGITILYGNLCAIPQRNLKRLLGYSSISNAGYLLLGVAAMSAAGQSAVLFFLGAYLVSVLGAFLVIGLVTRDAESEDVGVLAGLNQRSPFLAFTLSLSMISLAGIPPLAGFFGKFLLLKAVVEQARTQPAYAWLLAVALVGIVISLYYYFGVVRAIYWPKAPGETEPTASAPIPVSRPMRYAVVFCIGGMLYLGLFPSGLLNAALAAILTL
jgi:NADH-quinone oxidoreductase subunit N